MEDVLAVYTRPRIAASRTQDPANTLPLDRNWELFAAPSYN
jgi:hypothetical protein